MFELVFSILVDCHFPTQKIADARLDPGVQLIFRF